MGKHSPASSRIAHVEEADDDGEIVPGSKPKYARSTAPSSPTKKHSPNTGKTRRESRLDSSSVVTRGSTESSDSTEHPSSRRTSKMKSKGEKEKRRSSTVVVDKRPSVRSSKTTPAPSSRASDESSTYYGVPHQTVAASSSRPRSHTRPESYYGQSSRQHRPPLSSSAYYQQPTPSPSHFIPPSFPPQPWAVAPEPPMPPPAGSDHFNRPLALRFQRPQSAMGFQHSSSPHDYDPPQERSLAQRSSARKTSKDHDDRTDRMRMPPPPRPQSARPNTVGIRPPPPRKSVVFDDDDLDGDDSMYRAVARRVSVEYGVGDLPPRTRRRSGVDSIYANDGYELEPASRSRRGSHTHYDDQLRNATQYQDDVNGGPSALLTAEALRRVKNGGSSRSTRSSASRDESDYKHSATTRTTRSGSGDDDITIKVPMGAIVEVGNAKIHCKDGGDISLGRSGTSRGGSDRATSYGDERSRRSDRSTTTRTRTSSQAPSYHRGLLPLPPPPRYAPPMTYDPHALAYDSHPLPFSQPHNHPFPDYYDTSGQHYF
ncbi:Uu.00g091310.m01.CDS01 [Anthostomella pinea]|uniref:Uu.00g091310.m01.CDS01 n=1 Tax=Anthostomella pinea TaxID=933095 RepID=A0AAI8VP89_9PEZI|nr:Uu.00g091310.m01.CDS01 [Anthostomella pinea]